MMLAGRIAIAHELANLMTTIAGFTEFLGTGIEAKSPLRRDWESLRAAAHRACTLQSRIVGLLREPPAGACDVGATLDEWEPILRQLLGRSIGLRLTLPRGESVATQPTHLAQLVLNLAAQVRDCMPRGGAVHIDPLLAESEDRPGFSRFVVRGTGDYVVAAPDLALRAADRIATEVGGIILPTIATTADVAFEVRLPRSV